MTTPRLRTIVFTTMANGRVHPQLTLAHQRIISDLRRRHLQRDDIRRNLRRRLTLLEPGTAQNPIHVADHTQPVNPFHVVHLVAEGTMDDDCSICQEPITKGQDFARLHCSNIVNHCYHKECILPWLKNNNTCPVCRADLSRDNDDIKV